MEITQSNSQLTVKSVNDGSNYLHILQKVSQDTTSIVGYDFTTSQSDFTLLKDGYHIIYAYKFGVVIPTFTLVYNINEINDETSIIITEGDETYTIICSENMSYEALAQDIIDITGLYCVPIANGVQFESNTVTVEIDGDGIQYTKLYDIGEYYIENEKIYNWLGAEISMSNLVDIDTENTNIVLATTDYFNTYFIKKYYIELLTLKFQKICRTCTASLISSLSNKIFKIDKFNELTIDTIMMGLDVINYLIEYDLYMEADRIVSMLSTCSNIQSLNCNCYG